MGNAQKLTRKTPGSCVTDGYCPCPFFLSNYCNFGPFSFYHFLKILPKLWRPAWRISASYCLLKERVHLCNTLKTTSKSTLKRRRSIFRQIHQSPVTVSVSPLLRIDQCRSWSDEAQIHSALGHDMLFLFHQWNVSALRLAWRRARKSPEGLHDRRQSCSPASKKICRSTLYRLAPGRNCICYA